MIVFDLACHPDGHRFEGWFASSADFESQSERGLLCCPECGSMMVEKAPMAPAVGRKGNQLPAAQTRTASTNAPLPAEMQRAMAKLAAMQAEALKQSTWVGEEFAEQTREMHYGERDHATIHGQASLDDAKALLDEGIAVMPLPFPVAPPDEIN